MSDNYRIEIVMSVRPDNLYRYDTLTTKEIVLTATDDQLLSMFMADALQNMYTQTVTAAVLAAREETEDE